jgi:hypothetical protein
MILLLELIFLIHSLLGTLIVIYSPDRMKIPVWCLALTRIVMYSGRELLLKTDYSAPNKYYLDRLSLLAFDVLDQNYY